MKSWKKMRRKKFMFPNNTSLTKNGSTRKLSITKTTNGESIRSRRKQKARDQRTRRDPKRFEAIAAGRIDEIVGWSAPITGSDEGFGCVGKGAPPR